jgi:hypothetical protein
MDTIVLGPNPINIINEHIKVDFGDKFRAFFDLENIEKVVQHK